MGYKENDLLSQDADFLGRVKQCIAKNANFIASEATSGRFDKDKKRNTLANQVLNNPSNYNQRFAIAMIEASSLVGT